MTSTTEPKAESRKGFTDLAWWAAVIGLLLLTQLRVQSILHMLRETPLSVIFDPAVLKKDSLTVLTLVTPIRGMILLYSLLVLSYPIVQSLQQSDVIVNSRITKKHMLEVFLLFFVLCIIFTPGKIDGLAQEYANTSIVLFTKTATVHYNRRFLMPALANILFMRGDFFFLIFSFVCTFMLIFILRLWFASNQIQISFWQMISLGTISFIYFQIEDPGYPDVLVNIFILLAFLPGMNTRSKLSLFVLALASHEASLFIWFAFALTLFDTKGWIQFLIISSIYILLLVALNHGISGVLETRTFGGKSNLELVIENPMQELIGIFFSFKALWIIMISAVGYLLSQKKIQETIQIVSILAAGVVLTFMGVDASRLYGWTFMALLISWKILDEAEENWKKMISIVLVMNILIPSVDVYLYTVPSVVPGVYQYIFKTLFGI
jgi:hypothetical protein